MKPGIFIYPKTEQKSNIVGVLFINDQNKGFLHYVDAYNNTDLEITADNAQLIDEIVYEARKECHKQNAGLWSF